MMVKKKCIILILLLTNFLANSQGDTINLLNGSFEDIPTRGVLGHWSGIKNWTDCAPLNNFRGESPPDIHPNGFWEHNLPASHGKTYIGMVARDNGTYESVSQKLSEPLLPGKCYKISMFLAKAEKYMSLSRMTGDLTNYSTPLVLRIWGGPTLCNNKQLFAESEQIANKNWQIFSFNITPVEKISYLTFGAFYTPNTQTPYCGNLLLDGISPILTISCDD